MNPWSLKTVELVNNQDYLDKLQRIYPHEDLERKVAKSSIVEIRKSFSSKDDAGLLDKLLDLNKFPYKDSYIGFLRKDREAINRNPETVERISNHLYEMGIDNIIEGITAPKEANRRRGHQFTRWLRSSFKWVGMNEFRSSKKGIVFLEANELEARNFCNTEMGIGISKRPDIVAKSGSSYVVGEAKFLSALGGNQGRAFDDGMQLANNASGTAFKIFVLDGIIWIENGSDQYNRIQYGNSAVFSALLLANYLKSIA